MDTYSLFREFADSWMLLAMTLFFLGVVVWAFRPGSRQTHIDTADIPFRNDVAAPRKPEGCTCEGDISKCADANPDVYPKVSGELK